MVKEEVVLVNFWSSPFGSKVKIALEEKGIPYEYKEEDLLNKSSFLKTINPVYGKVPVLIHNNNSICESLNIIEYINEVWSDRSPSFFPSDPHERAQARFWADFINKELYEASKKIYRCTGEEQVSGKKEVLRILKLVEGQLGDKTFFGGDNLGIVDITLIPFYSRFYTWETFGKFSIEEECPNLVAWAKRCSQKESVVKSLPDPIKMYEFILYLNKHLAK
ncbi:Glutathione S-transferase/chloride channel, C-terminal [Artemisia annua]|uniref:Glutathione S-transferase n=1 Tax=Artemisia annua TaxID=35608 RepID=A0A2U1KQH1_ARTAN|nr:Glutathione S-transferase/chloride channel, C-terminal [Artemisia annua]